MYEKKTDYSLRSAELVIDLLDLLLSDDSAKINLPYVSEKLHIHRNKAFRLLSTLEKRGMVERDEWNGCYRVGLTAVEFSQRILNKTNIIVHAHPVMEELARKHEEAVYMTVLKGEEVMFLDMVDCDQPVKAAPLVGQRFPLFSTAAGKVIKALESRDLLEKLFTKKSRKNDFQELVSLETELEDIRKKGVAVDCGGLGEGIISVAVAVKDYTGKVVGAITLLGPSFRMLASRLENEIIPSMLEGAELLSGKFGYARA